MNAVVNADLFRIVYSCASTEETRYYLNGVFVEPHPVKGAILVATDGRRMLVAHDKDGTCSEPVIVQLPKFALTQCRAPKLFDRKRELEIDGSMPGSVTIVDVTPGMKKEEPPTREAVTTIHRTTVDGTFPDWRRVVAKESVDAGKSAPTAFQSKYLKAWGAAGEDIGRAFSASGEAQIGISDGGSPTLIRFGGAEFIFGVQMPFRSDVRGFLPPFMDEPEKLQAAE